MNFEIVSYVSVGPLHFGMTVDEVRERLLPAQAVPFMKATTSEHPTDAFDSLGLHVFYRRDGIFCVLKIRCQNYLSVPRAVGELGVDECLHAGVHFFRKNQQYKLSHISSLG